MRLAKIRLTRNSSTTPASVSTLAAMATLVLVGCEAQAMRIDSAAMRAMQKPNSRPENTNLWSRRMLSWKMAMCVAAAATKNRSSTAHTGSSTPTSGSPPSCAVCGRYGGPDGGPPGPPPCWLGSTYGGLCGGAYLFVLASQRRGKKGGRDGASCEQGRPGVRTGGAVPLPGAVALAVDMSAGAQAGQQQLSSSWHRGKIASQVASQVERPHNNANKTSVVYPSSESRQREITYIKTKKN